MDRTFTNTIYCIAPFLVVLLFTLKMEKNAVFVEIIFNKLYLRVQEIKVN